jgi:hypothetical protein
MAFGDQLIREPRLPVPPGRAVQAVQNNEHVRTLVQASSG